MVIRSSDYWHSTYYSRYKPEDSIICWLLWRFNNYNDRTESNNDAWTNFYEARHYSYPNIPSGEKPYEFNHWFSGGNSGWIWALNMRLYLIN